MEPYEYQTLYELEENYWWFRGLRAILFQEIRRRSTRKEQAVLDVGCGTGFNLSHMAQQIPAQLFGCDLASAAVPFWKKKKLDRVCLSSANDLSFRAQSVDIVSCIDVLECNGVDAERVIGEVHRVLRPGGYAFFLVPAFHWLYSKEHDRAVDASRRFMRSEFLRIVSEKKFEIARASYLYPTLFPMIAAYRLFERFGWFRSSDVPRSNIKKLPAILNELLSAIVLFEAFLFRLFSFPWGSSLFVIVRKSEV